MTVQTAFRIDESLVNLMKKRAKMKKQSVNAYVVELIEKDIAGSLTLPKIRLPEQLDEDIMRYAGAMRNPSEEELLMDDRLRRIWER